MKEMFIHPISIDLGASHTGVYSAHYQAGANAQDIEKSGFVYILDKNAYTLLMDSRTAKRHQRRGFDRCQMAKRLLKLIWTEHFKLDWNDDVAQTLGFLLNRRGFSFLFEEYDQEALRGFPKDVWNNELSDEFKSKIGADVKDNTVDLSDVIEDLSKDQQEKCADVLQPLLKKVKVVKTELLYFNRTKILKQYSESKKNNTSFNNKTRKKLQNISSWIIQRWIASGVPGLSEVSDKDIAEYIDKNLNNLETIISSIPDYTKEEQEYKKSIWNFNESEFNSEESNLVYPEEKNFEKSHIHHLTYALNKINNELISGGRHRKKYFDELKSILDSTKHTHGYLKRFCSSLKNGKYKNLNSDNLTNLIGHISNLELKPLRKYFNCTKHKTGDYWDEKRMQNFFENWIIKEWRVSPEKDREKQIGKSQDYRAFKQRWKEHDEGLIDFWLKESPLSTIPPYQNNNNRRPPRCQSLILNPDYLNDKYPGWQTWLKTIENVSSEHLGDYRSQLEQLKSGKEKAYFSEEGKTLGMADLDARILQFILDRRKDSDPLKLNEIYSHTKKIRQLKNAKKEFGKEKQNLEEVLSNSQLSDKLKTQAVYNSDDIFPQGTFLNFVCHYYKQRQRARDGRIFIHPEYKHTTKRVYEKTRRFDSSGKLLTYCNHKPRQKRYQVFHDTAAIFQVSVKSLKAKVRSTSEDKLVEWFEKFNIKTHCKNCADAQKKHRGDLNTLIASGKNKALTKLKDNSVTISKKIAKELFEDQDEEKAKKFESVYSFAQIHNILFSDRNGFSKTCPVCSADNSYRMQNDQNLKKELHAKAQRLPAIPTRVIDGAVKRMARILSGQIANDQWPKIEEALKQDKTVRIPIITESNRFEFEPSLNSLKNKKKGGVSEDKTFEEKEERIKNDGNSICPYTGKSVSSGELDHIIPRSSGWGTLNDEANLIYASKDGNKEKGKQSYTLSNLHSNYKKSLFDTENIDQIEGFIKSNIWDSKNKIFTFGQYKSFINLEPEHQKAFRHALFLDEGNEIKKAVLQAISNRTRALVNGTQRYFTEVLANTFHKKALAIDKKDLLDFDFFAVEATSNSRGDGIKDLRRLYEFMYEDLDPFRKQSGTKQEFYSHLLDAHMAFLLIADQHNAEGSLQLEISDNRGLFPVNDNGEVSQKNLFTDTRIDPDPSKFHVCDLKRKKPQDGFSDHRAYTRDTMYADHYLPLLLKKTNDGKVSVRAGYSWKNSGEWKIPQKGKKQAEAMDILNRLLPLLKQRKHFPGSLPVFGTPELLYEWLVGISYFCTLSKKGGYISLSIDKNKFHEYLMKEHNTKANKPFDKFAEFILSDLGYRTEKRNVILPEMNASTGKKLDLDTTLADPKIFRKKFGKSYILLPQEKSWIKLKKRWESEEYNDNNKIEVFLTFIKKYFTQEKRDNHAHQKVRKVFSLPVKTTEGKYLIRRKGWDRKVIYQIVNDSDSRSPDNKPMIPVEKPDGNLGSRLASWAVSENFVNLSGEQSSQGSPIDPNHWYELDTGEKPLPNGISALSFQVPNNTRPMIKLKISQDTDQFDFLVELFKNNELCKRRKDKEKDIGQWQSEIEGYKSGQSIHPYSGSSEKQLKTLWKNRKK